jgi:hypothetical protein
VKETDALFSSAFELRVWLDSEKVVALTAQGHWPTPETANIWRTFRESFAPATSSAWSEYRFNARVFWRDGKPPSAGQPVQVYSDPETGDPLVLSESAELLGQLRAPLNPSRQGLARFRPRES